MGPETSADFARARAIGSQHMAAFDRTPEVVAFAPGRVNLMGDHTDYNGGAVLPMAIDFGTVCALSRRDDNVVRIVSHSADGLVHTVVLDEFDKDADGGWLAYVAGCIILATENGWWHGGLDMSLDGDLPLGAGLSSSASLECAVLTALVSLNSEPVDLWTLALTAHRVEHEYAHVPCGIMDQATSMLAEAGSALHLDTSTRETTQVALHLDLLDAQILLIDTNAHHELTDGGYADRRASCEAAAGLLGVTLLAQVDESDLARVDSLPPPLDRRARHVITENARVPRTTKAFEDGDIGTLERLFAQSHTSLAQDFEVSCAELDVAVDAARTAGASAARMTGGGFGGSVVTITPNDRLADVEASVRAAFASQGFPAPAFMTVRPSAGARLIYRDVP